jgi:DNA-binding transcriptional regulator YiaG
VAQALAEALKITESAGIAGAMRYVLQDARLTDSERVARRICDCVRGSGLTQAEFAARLGTSQSRLSTYVSGSVTPSAILLDRIEAVSNAAKSQRPSHASATEPARR